MPSHSAPSPTCRLRQTLAVALLAAAVLPVAADLGDLADTWRWADFTTESGLPSAHVRHMTQTPTGTLWAGTEAGLAWYDDFQWHAMAPGSGLPAAMPTSLTAAPSGHVLAVIGGVLYRGDRSGFAAVPVTHQGLDLTVAAAVPHGDAVLVLAGDHLYSLRDGVCEPFAEPADPPFVARGDSPPLCRTRAGSLYLLTTGGVYQWSGATWDVVVPGLGVRELAETRAGGLLLGVQDPLDQRGTWERFPGSPLGRIALNDRDLAVALDVSPAGQALAVYESGLVRHRGDHGWRTLTAPRLQYASMVWFADNGDLWVGRQDGLSLYRASSRRWTYSTDAGNDLRNRVMAVLETRDGSLWIGTDAGVGVVEDAGPVRWIDRADGVKLDIVTAVTADSMGHVWVGSGSAFTGVLRWDGRSWQHLGVAAGLGHVHAIDVDRQGRPWFLTLDTGAWVLGPHGPVPWPHTRDLPGARLYAFADAGERGLWFGYLGGLSRWRDGRWNHWGPAQGLPSVFALVVDPNDRLWFGLRNGRDTFGYVDRGDTLRFVDPHPGDEHVEVWDLAADPSGSLWLATNTGLIRYADGIASSFGPDAGLSSRFVWPLFLADDQLLVGTQGGGLAILDLSEAGDPPPRVSLTLAGDAATERSIRIGVHPYRGGQRPSSIPVRHRLDGGLWSTWDASRQLSLAGLGYGSHVAHVQAMGLFGNTDPQGSELRFELPTPLHRQPAFFLPLGGLCFLVLALAGVILRRQRRYRQTLRTNLAFERLLTETLKMETEQDWERLVAAFGRELRTLVRAHGVSINLVQPDGQVTAYMDRPKGPGITRFASSDAPVLLEVMASGRSSYRATRAEIAAGRDDPRLPSTRVQSVVDAPFSGGTIAMNSLRPRAFSGEDLVLLERFALILSEAHRRLQDLQERLLNAEQVQQTQRLQMINRLATGVAHEINNPLTHILGYSQLLLKRPLGEPERGYVTTILNAGQRAGAITSRLVAYNRRQQSSPREFDLSELAVETADLVRYDFEMVRARLQQDVEPHAIVRAHPGEIQQALISLLQNAQDAVVRQPGSGAIRIELRRLECRAHLDVIDDGPGIPPELIARLFEPFFSTKPVGEGTGLGLSQCRALVIRNGGQLAYLPSDRGARFSIQLPLLPAIPMRSLEETPAHDIANASH